LPSFLQGTAFVTFKRQAKRQRLLYWNKKRKPVDNACHEAEPPASGFCSFSICEYPFNRHQNIFALAV
jgi:hypothetical protein